LWLADGAEMVYSDQMSVSAKGIIDLLILLATLKSNLQPIHLALESHQDGEKAPRGQSSVKTHETKDETAREWDHST
jgi:hypothetical protein